MKSLKLIFALCVGMLLSSAMANHFGASNAASVTIGAFLTVGSLVVSATLPSGSLAGISYANPVVITGDVYEEVMNEVLYVNNTIKKGLVRFIDNVKSNVPIKGLKTSVSFQQYTSGAPTSAGSLNPFDRLITPYKGMFYNEFDYETLRSSAWNKDMAAGAYEIVSDEFTRAAVAAVGPKQSLSLESMFWTGAKSATKTAVAALTAGTTQGEVSTAEKALVAAMSSSYIDGVITKLIYSDEATTGTYGVGARIKVAGTTVSSSNIKTETDKVYAAIPTKLLQPENISDVVIYMPHENRALINIYNNTPSNYKDAFVVNGDSFTFNGIPIEFVPIPANTMIAGNKMDFVWATDLVDDQQNIRVDRIANNREDFFMKSIVTIESWIFFQSEKVLYVG